MSSPLLALFTRSLREDLRGSATYWARGGLGGFIVFILLVTAASNTWSGAPGRIFFIGIISLQAMAITFVGLSYFASAVAEEKEEQTLGLLRMTALNPLSILLGKSTSRLCGALLLLAAVFPFTVFAVTLGGISLRQIGASYCTLGAYTFLLCNLALLGSVLARRTAGAAAFCVLGLAVFFGASGILELCHEQLADWEIPSTLDSAAALLWSMTPIARLREVLSTGFTGSPIGWQVASNLALGVAFFLLAWAAFGRFCDRALNEASAVAGPAPRWFGVNRRRPPRPRKDALAWKDFHFLCGGRIALLTRTMIYGLALASIVSGAWGFGYGTSYALILFVFSLDVAVMASRIFRTEINEQTLGPLAALPLTMREIAHRKTRACLLAALPGALCMIAGGVISLLPRVGTGIKHPITGEMLSSWLNVPVLAVFVAWLSLRLKRGALPLGFVILQFFHAVVSLSSMLLLGLGSLAVGAFALTVLAPLLTAAISIAVVVFLHRESLRRLEALAGEN